MKQSICRLLIAGALSLAAFSSYADDDLYKIESISKGLGLIPLEQAQAKALSEKSGVITDTDLEKKKFGKGWVYEIEIVDADGNEWEVNIDAKTGAVLGVTRDWF